jgi:HEPN domain-containing protein
MLKLASSYLRQAESRLKDAEDALKEGNHPYTVRLCQECVELSLKASLRLVGIEYPKVHDVSDLLVEVKERFPKWFKREAEEFAKVSRSLTSKRELAFYGYNDEAISPEEVIGRKEAEAALKGAGKVYRLCKRLYEALKAA